MQRPANAPAPVPRALRALSRPGVLAGLTLAAVVLADQLCKRAVEHSIAQGEERKFLPGISFVHARNRGIAFGLLPGSDTIVTVLIAIALGALLVYFVRHREQPLMWLPTGLLLGGAIGNLIDRARTGRVTDFIQLPLGWPPFNIADAAITAGIALMLLLLDHHRHRSKIGQHG